MFYLERQGAVALLRYRHPPRGFLTAQALAELRRLVLRLERDESVRVIVLCGEPDRFIAHTELDEIAHMLALTARLPRLLLPLFRLWVWLARRLPWLAELGDPLLAAPLHVLIGFDALQRSRKITIAACDGPCVGGGLELALCCDFRLAADSDTHLIGCPEVRLGLIPGFGGSQRLAALIGAARARQLLLSGELLTPAQAAQLGIVSRLLARDNFEEEVLRFAHDLAQRPPLAVAALKRALTDEVWGRLWVELREVAGLAGSGDLALGLSEYRRALDENDDPESLLSQMSRVRFEGR
jgi:enoyl-CoA hydratase/carnithine racemase